MLTIEFAFEVAYGERPKVNGKSQFLQNSRFRGYVTYKRFKNGCDSGLAGLLGQSAGGEDYDCSGYDGEETHFLVLC